MMKENKLVDLSMDFAIKIIKLCETIKGHDSSHFDRLHQHCKGE